MSRKSLEEVVTELQQSERLIIETRSALPFDTHMVNIDNNNNNKNNNNNCKKNTSSRTSAILNPISFFTSHDAHTKKPRSYTTFETNVYIKDSDKSSQSSQLSQSQPSSGRNFIQNLSRSPKSSGATNASKSHHKNSQVSVGESSFYDMSSDSDDCEHVDTAKG